MPKGKKEISADILNAIEELKTTVLTISKAVENIKSLGINPDALYTLIQKAAPHRVGIDKVRIVCEGIENLEEYVFPEELQ